MRKFTVIAAALGIQPGAVLGLTFDQAEPRAHALKTLTRDDKKRQGTYEVLSRVEFKLGETIYTSADLNKALAESLEPEEVTQEKAKAKKASKKEEAAQAELAGKAKAWDDLQPSLDDLYAKAAAFDLLPEQQRKDLLEQVKSAAGK